jgi:hypothetical protein
MRGETEDFLTVADHDGLPYCLWMLQNMRQECGGRAPAPAA